MDDMPSWDLPEAPHVNWNDLPPPDADPALIDPPRREGLWVIEGDDIVWDAPLAGTWT